MATAEGPKYHILHYDYVPDILERRAPFREQHLQLARQEFEKGRMVMAGACGNPVDGAVFIFQNIELQDIEEYVKGDPYVNNGLVPSWSIKPYNVAIGPLSSS